MLIYVSQKDGGIDLYNAYLKARENQVVDKGCHYQPFVRKINEVMKKYKVKREEPRRKDSDGDRGKICAQVYKIVPGITDRKVIEEYNLLLQNEDPKDVVKNYKSNIPADIKGWMV